MADFVQKYYLRNHASGRVASIDRDDGIPVRVNLSTRKGRAARQIWVLERDSNNPNYYRILNPKTNKVMANHGRLRNGAKIKPTNVFENADGQLWSMKDVGNAYKVFINKLSGKALTIAPGTADNEGEHLRQIEYMERKRFHWYLVPATNKYTIDDVFQENTHEITPTVDWEEFDPNDYRDLDRLLEWTEVQLGPETHDATLKSIVILCTVTAVAVSLIGASMAAAPAVPLTVAAVGGTLQIGGTVGRAKGWSWWQTDSDEQWDAIKKLYYRTDTTINSEIAVALGSTMQMLRDAADVLNTAEKKVVPWWNPDEEVKSLVREAYDNLDDLHDKLSEVRNLITLLNSPESHPDAFAKYNDEHGHPDTFMLYWDPYLLLHARVLHGIWQLSDERTGRNTGYGISNLGTITHTFLSESRAGLVATMRSRQQKQIEACAMRSKSEADPTDLTETVYTYSIYYQEEEIISYSKTSTSYGREQAEEKLFSLRKEVAAEIYNEDKRLVLVFNTVLKLLSNELGVMLPSQVQPLAENDVIFPDEQYT